MSRIVILLLALGVAGCTPYQEVGEAGGYFHQRLDENVYKITFSANGFTDYKRARDFAFFRAAEICAKLGYTHFVVEGQGDRSSASSVDLGSTSYTEGTAYGYGRSASYYGTTSTYHNRMSVFKPAVELVVRYFNGTPTGRYLEVFEARAVIAKMNQKYGLNIEVPALRDGISAPRDADQSSSPAQESNSVPPQRMSEPSGPSVPAKRIVDYKAKKDASGEFVTDRDGHFIIVPVYEDEVSALRDDGSAAQRVSESASPNGPPKRIIDYKAKKDASGEFVTDKDGHFVLVPVYGNEQEK